MSSEPQSSNSTSPGVVRDDLTALRDTARSNASQNLELAADTQRAIDALDWGVQAAKISELPRLYSTELQKANSELQQGRFVISSAQSAVQLVVSASATATAASSVIEFGRALADAPAFLHLETQDDLDRLLDWALPTHQLPDKRRDAWMALERGTAESTAQACHSMREILTALLDELADSDSVKAASWWTPAPDTKDGVSKRQKIRFLMVREDQDASGLDIATDLDLQVDSAYAAHDRAIQVAHHRTAPSYDAARLVLIDLEQIMLAVLKYRWSLGRCGQVARP